MYVHVYLLYVAIDRVIYPLFVTHNGTVHSRVRFTPACSLSLFILYIIRVEYTMPHSPVWYVLMLVILQELRIALYRCLWPFITNHRALRLPMYCPHLVASLIVIAPAPMSRCSSSTRPSCAAVCSVQPVYPHAFRRPSRMAGLICGGRVYL